MSRPSLFLTLFLYSVLTLGFTAAEEAADLDIEKATVTELRHVDSDFKYQGEYWGSAWDPCSGCVPVGLQVVARGDGKFDAIEYRCGLPGAGWDGERTRKLSGAVSEDVLALHGESVEILADGAVATLCDSAGKPLGQLRKIERVSPTLHAVAPSGAHVLFDGSSTDQWVGGKTTADGLLEVGSTTKAPVGDFRLHVEFRIPYMPRAAWQGRGNSGVYIQQRYEVQILDSFGAEGLKNDCGALYQQTPPDVNMSLPPLSWQTYDLWFTAARWDQAGKKTANARITLLHNGVPVHSNREITSKTGAGKPEGPENLPILFQNHGNPVHFRNIWMVPDLQSSVARETGVRFPRLGRLLQRMHRGR